MQFLKEKLEKMQTKGIYRLTSSTLDIKNEGDEIILLDSINNYNALIVATGNTGQNGSYFHTLCMPWLSQFTAGSNEKAEWITGDTSSAYIPVCNANGEKIVLHIENTTKLVVASSNANSGIRAVYGIKI